jgi:hypothetical protein
MDVWVNKTLSMMWLHHLGFFQLLRKDYSRILTSVQLAKSRVVATAFLYLEGSAAVVLVLVVLVQASKLQKIDAI